MDQTAKLPKIQPLQTSEFPKQKTHPVLRLVTLVTFFSSKLPISHKIIQNLDAWWDQTRPPPEGIYMHFGGRCFWFALWICSFLKWLWIAKWKQLRTQQWVCHWSSDNSVIQSPPKLKGRTFPNLQRHKVPWRGRDFSHLQISLRAARCWDDLWPAWNCRSHTCWMKPWTHMNSLCNPSPPTAFWHIGFPASSMKHFHYLKKSQTLDESKRELCTSLALVDSFSRISNTNHCLFCFTWSTIKAPHVHPEPAAARPYGCWFRCAASVRLECGPLSRGCRSHRGQWF